MQVSASLGFAVYPEDGPDPDALLKNADAAMYHAKELGRNSYRAFSRALAARRDERFGIEQSLRRALRDGERSGWVEDFSMDKLIDELDAERGAESAKA